MILTLSINRLTILIACLLFANSFDSYVAGGSKSKVKGKSLEQQITAFIPFPETLNIGQASVTAVSFRTDESGLITEVQSHSGVKKLDMFLIRALNGKNWIYWAKITRQNT